MIEGSEIISISCNSTVEEAIFFMKRNNIRRIVVICEDKIEGIFTVDEALSNLIYRSEERLGKISLKPAIKVKSSSYIDVVKSMIEQDVDSVIYKNKIITEKDVVFTYEWGDEYADSLSHEAISVEGFTSLVTAINIMVKQKIRHLPVIEREPLGMLSARDILYYYSEKLDLNVSVRDVMTPKIIEINKGTTMTEAVKIMKENNIGSLMTGLKIITLRDFIKYIYRHI
ncbi:signal transduction protein [Candidatus Acidianus copahuensis]|uniref:Signal transduction protein n=1 Tax=Candidatus Acidianus copahuensis TaxID=1160895 RepID=A0A031LMU1_9CREN|nr:signal transduction protein [Candidatus Acidianus copahuensis]